MTNRQQQDEFMTYPDNVLFGIIDDPAPAQQAIRDLATAGFGEDAIQVFLGAEGAARIDASGAQHGGLAPLVRLVQSLGLEREHAGRYEEASRHGHTVVAVYAVTQEAKEQALKILRAQQGHFINYYSSLAIETIDR